MPDNERDCTVVGAYELLSALIPTITAAECEWQQVAAGDAPEFGVVELLAPNENRLSRIIAELLRPNGSHGQGSLFLNLFLQHLGRSQTASNDQTLSVECESRTYTIANDRRRIDILIDGGSWGIGVENKPWAREQELQLEDYTNHLRKKFSSNFLLLHLGGSGGDVTSLSPEDCAKLTKQGQFKKWLYHKELAAWLRDCAAVCRSDRVKYFLNELIRYIETKFGGVVRDYRSFMQQQLLPQVRELISKDNQALGAYTELVELFPTVRKQLVDELFTAVEERIRKELGGEWDSYFCDNDFCVTPYSKMMVWHKSWGNGEQIGVCLESWPRDRMVVLGGWKNASIESDESTRALLRDLGWGSQATGSSFIAHSPLPEPFRDWTAPSYVFTLVTKRQELEEFLVTEIVKLARGVECQFGKLAKAQRAAIP